MYGLTGQTHLEPVETGFSTTFSNASDEELFIEYM
jgi:hypothetical protein